MNARVTVSSIKLMQDSRGYLFEPLDAETLSHQKNAHFVLTEPGVVRGNHVHRRNREVAAIYGPALVRVREEGDIRDIHVPDGEAFQFTFPPGVSHAIKNVGDRPMILIAFNSEVFDAQNPDTESDLLIES